MPQQPKHSADHPDELRPNELLARIRGEFLEMPGMRLTPGQAARLWHLSERAAVAALEALTEGGFLARTVAGTYARRSGA
jgi:hypothetical protein